MPPKELWPDASFDLAKGSMSTDGMIYLAVTIGFASSSSEETLAGEIGAWLSERRLERGVETKKVLKAEAMGALGRRFRSRVFDRAYSVVHDRTRGRPDTPRLVPVQAPLDSLDRIQLPIYRSDRAIAKIIRALEHGSSFLPCSFLTHRFCDAVITRNEKIR